MSAQSDFVAHLTALVHKSRSQRENTLIAGFKVSPPWEGMTWDGVRFYNAQQDPRVVNKDALPVRYITGSDVLPHITLGAINEDQKMALEEFKTATEPWLSELAFVCKDAQFFPTPEPALLLGAQGYGSVVVKLEVPQDIRKLRVALQVCVPHPAEVHGAIGTEPTPWNPHVTVGYVADQASAQQLQSLLTAYIGQKVKVHGWL